MEKYYYLVSFDDHHGNMGNRSEIIDFFKENGFICRAGYWGCPWYFVDIENNCYYPGRPGVGYGKVIEDRMISFDELREKYRKVLK